MATINLNVSVSYDIDIDSETGNIVGFKIVNRSVKPKEMVIHEKEESEQQPYVRITGNSLVFNKAAIALTGFKPDDYIDIRYNNGIPVMAKLELFGLEEGGNKFTKSGTLRFKGTKNAVLSRAGYCFLITQDENREGLFILNGDKNTPVFETEELIPEPINKGILDVKLSNLLSKDEEEDEDDLPF